MIYLYANTLKAQKFLENLLKIKHIPFQQYTAKYQQKPIFPELLIYHNTFVAYSINIADFLDRKHPYPCLIPENPEKRAIVLTTTTHILNEGISLTEEKTFKEIRNPFIAGTRISLIDLVLEPLLKDAAYSELVKELYNEQFS